MQGEPFKYFAYGAAAAEVEVDGFTGAYRLRRADIVHDVGDSLSPLVDLGQIEGGFVQGVGWLTLEELLWDETDGPHRGRLNTQAASTYKIPSFSEMPPEFNVHLFERATESGVVYGSKAVGEPPLMEAFSVREALRQAVAAFGPAGWSVDLGCPSTPEAVYWAVQAARDARPDPAPAAAPAYAGSDDGLAQSRAAATGRRPARRAGHRGRGARARAARGRRQDGGQPRPHLGQRRRRQPGGDRRRPGPGADRVRGRRAGDARGPAQPARAERAWPPVLRRRRPAAARAAPGPAGHRAVRPGARRLRAGPDPVPAAGPAAAGRLAPRAAGPGPARRRDRRRRGRRHPPHDARRAGARAAAAWRARRDHDARPRGGLRAVRRGPAAAAAAGRHRADRLERQVDAVPGPARRGRARPGGDRPDHLPDRPARHHRQGPRRHRRRGRRRAAGSPPREPKGRRPRLD